MLTLKLNQSLKAGSCTAVVINAVQVLGNELLIRKGLGYLPVNQNIETVSLHKNL